MRELSVEEKAKAYDKAVERAKGAHNSAKSDKENGVTDKITEYTIQLTETIFPELKESEGERIRKEVVDFICWATDRGSITAEQREKSNSWLAWLEKQGKKVEPIEGFNSEFERQVSCLIASAINKEHEYNEGYVKWTANALLEYAKRELEKQAGRKSSWSEEEEKNIDRIIDTILCAKSNRNGIPKALYTDEILDELVDWLKFLKDRVGCAIHFTTTKEWSEEDKKALKVVTEVFEQYGVHLFSYPAFVHWLKTLPNRITFNLYWKPSEEQMELIKDIVFKDRQKITRKELAIFHSIYNDLKKLKE